jgi:hypothetical protein
MLPNLVKLDNAAVTPEEKQQCAALSEADLIGIQAPRSNSAMRQAPTPTVLEPQVKSSGAYQSQPSVNQSLEQHQI